MPYFTDRELLEQFEFGSILLENQLHSNKDFLKESDSFPFMTVISPTQNLKIVHTNKKHEELTGYTLENIQKDCKAYLKDIVHPTTLISVKSFLPDFYRNQNMHQTISFLQYTKIYGKKGYSPIITFTKPPEPSQKLALRMIISPDKLGNMAQCLRQIVKMDQFRLKNFRKFQLLSNREIQVLKLLAKGSNNPAIAEKLFISRFTVETHRKSIKRKLCIRSNKEIMQFAIAFELIKM